MLAAKCSFSGGPRGSLGKVGELGAVFNRDKLVGSGDGGGWMWR